ncbi:MAG TPA: GMC family oxidoreductase [Gaiellaceae bacterium]
MRDFDVLVVGSGFGGSVAALRLAEKGYRVGVLEAGRRFGPDLVPEPRRPSRHGSHDPVPSSLHRFPKTSWRVRRFLWSPKLGCRGIQRLTLLRDVLVLSGAGVGGGSLVYANVLWEPPAEVWPDPAWAEELAPYYALARRMLGVTETPFESAADVVMRQVAERLGCAETYGPTPVGVWFGEDGVDPYFGGAGPERNGCVRCGGCMVGCRYGAKNTLDRNYLWFAERLGAEVIPEREATRIVPTAEGFEVETRRPGWSRRRETFRAAEVVLAAGTLGTLKLLLASGLGGEGVGADVRTNSEALLGAAAKRLDVDYSEGIAIGSSFRPDADTHVEPVRYPKRSNLMGLLGTILVDGGGRVPRQLRFLGQVLRHPLVFLLSLSVRRWSERTIILLVMQARPSFLRVRLRRGRLTTEQGAEPVPSYLPVANETARIASELIGGYPGSSLNEVLLDVPTTAHCFGGATAAGGVVDRFHRVLSQPGLHVVDGAAVEANLGVNPSLTIAAQAERALALWPNRGDPDPRPPLGAPYARTEPVPARSPALPQTTVTA